MSKLWLYNNYDPITKIYSLGSTIKTPEIISPLSPGVDYTEIFESTVLTDLESSSYSRHRIAGQVYYDNLRAKYMLQVELGNIPVSLIFHIDDITRGVTREVESGSWPTGHRDALLLPIDAIFTQTLKDKMLLDLKTYINANYPIELHVI